jgi:hypothetical protein
MIANIIRINISFWNSGDAPLCSMNPPRFAAKAAAVDNLINKIIFFNLDGLKIAPLCHRGAFLNIRDV